MLGDTGLPVALIARSGKSHRLCLEIPDTIRSRQSTTLPCLTETIYLLKQYGGGPLKIRGEPYIEDGIVLLHLSTDTE